MNRKELIKKYIEFFESKGHKKIPNNSLIPENDPTVLFTTAGMHPLVPYLLGQKHPLGKRLTGIQRCIRTGDIKEVGDSFHHTFFEMLGNWSLGDYWKKEAIGYSFEFLTKELKIPKEKLAVTIFSGDKIASADTKSKEIWKKLKIMGEKITPLGREDNWWGPAGLTGPCGPDTEMFYWKNKSQKVPEKFNPNDSTLAAEGYNWVEIWNDVFMEYTKEQDGRYIEAKQKNVDTGMGVERTIAILNGFEDNYESEMWKSLIEKIEKISGKKYEEHKKEMRIIADHIKAAVFIISDGVIPGNKERGYVLRKLVRRAIIYGKKLELKKFTGKIAEPVFEIYDDYNELKDNKKKILKILEDEESKFEKTLEKGIKEVKKMSINETISGKDAFLLYQSYGFPIELTKELATEKGSSVDEKSFYKEFQKHQKLSKTASAGKFKSGPINNSAATTCLHTATHLLNEALRQILKDKNITQRGSNITPERLRFDFNYERKLTDGEKKKIEDWINDKIKKDLIVTIEKMNLSDAIKAGAQAEFGAKYPKRVSVYTVVDKKEKKGFVSKEICTGPHVKHIGEIGKFRIIKEESSSAGVRRIKAVLE